MHLIKLKGQGCMIFKRDLKRGYRQLAVDPAGIHLLGYKWRGHVYFDRVLNMVLRYAAYMCMRTTYAIAYICKDIGIDILNYLDNLAGCESPEKSWDAFNNLGHILDRCGFEESVEKACPPNTKIIFVGILLDAKKLTISIDEQRLAEISQLVLNWLTKQVCNKKELQCLLGKLNFVSHCVRPGRIFVNILLNWLREIPEKGQISIPDDFKLDLCWWRTFLPSYNEVSLMLSEEWSRADQVFSLDSCLIGCGGWMNVRYFHYSFLDFILSENLHINICEMLTVVVALKAWGSNFFRKKNSYQL